MSEEKQTRAEVLKAQIRLLPAEPGVYRYYNGENELIYVGKARSLKSRVTNWFSSKGQLDRKSRRMISQVMRIEFTVTPTEYDALLLENNLIKQNQPRYNVLMRDDKTYPYVLITNEPFPRIFPTRRLDRSRGTFFGPYSSVSAMKNVLDLVRKIFNIRTCNLPLTPTNVTSGKFKVCLEYSIGNCKGPCENYQTLDEYKAAIENAKAMLKGNLAKARQYLVEQMQKYAVNLNFERAQQMKERLDLLDRFQAKSTVVPQNLTEIDVFGFVTDEKAVYACYMQIMQGAVIHTLNYCVKRKLEETNEELIALIISHLRDKLASNNAQILVNIDPQLELPGIELTVPQIGDKKKLVNLAVENAMYYRRDLRLKAGQQAQLPRFERVLKQMQKDLQLKELPVHIECFDNSNTQGTNAVSACVVFKNGSASKKDYRHFNVKTVAGPDDFATMREVVFRRYRRLLEEEQPLPQLIVIDGGKGQLSAAVESLEKLNLYGKIPVIGIAKRLEEIYYPEDEVPISIDKRSETLKLIQRMRDEAHRFGITHHRQKRSKANLKNDLEDLPGFGPATVEKLLKTYKSVKRAAEAPESELDALLGPKKAGIFRGFVAGRRAAKGAEPESSE